jgi:uncharacterized protein (DUF427 family)
LVLQPSHRRSFCEWKGEAIYFDVLVQSETLRDVAWNYRGPNPAFGSLRIMSLFTRGLLTAALTMTSA